MIKIKVLVFTHKSDIDGMGSIILTKLCYEFVDYVLCDASNLKSNFMAYLENDKIYEYDIVYITDLWLDDELLQRIKKDEKLKTKVYAFDHHREILKENYNFVTLRVEDSYGICCATSLFYEYLVQNKIIVDKPNIKEFVELTRRYDTWEWKNKYNDEKANHLTILFKVLGIEGYIESIVNKLNSESKTLEFSSLETNLINNKINQIQEKVKICADNISYRDILGYKVGIVFISKEINNDFAEYVRENNYNMDIIMEICMENGGISFRSIKDGIGVRKLAKYFGGNGHDYAAGAVISKETQESLIDNLINSRENNESFNY